MPDGDDLKGWSKNDLIREVRRLREVASQVLRRSGGDTLMFESGVNDKGNPFVRMWWGEESGQITVDEAYQHARHVMEVAAAAHFDAAFFRLFSEKMEVDQLTLWHLLADLRNYRGSDDTQSGRTSMALRPTDRPQRQEG